MTYVHYFNNNLVGITKSESQELRIYTPEGVQVPHYVLNEMTMFKAEVLEWILYCKRHCAENERKKVG